MTSLVSGMFMTIMIMQSFIGCDAHQKVVRRCVSSVLMVCNSMQYIELHVGHGGAKPSLLTGQEVMSGSNRLGPSPRESREGCNKEQAREGVASTYGSRGTYRQDPGRRCVWLKEVCRRACRRQAGAGGIAGGGRAQEAQWLKESLGS